MPRLPLSWKLPWRRPHVTLVVTVSWSPRRSPTYAHETSQRAFTEPASIAVPHGAEPLVADGNVAQKVPESRAGSVNDGQGREMAAGGSTSGGAGCSWTTAQETRVNY